MESLNHMKFRTFRQEKLWRDNAITMIEKEGSIVHWERLNDDAFDKQLRVKIVEEVQEVVSAKTKEALIEEIADVFEVINALCLLHGFIKEDIIAAQNKKFAERGGFEGRKYVHLAQHPEGSFGEHYCLKDPTKYPEIID